MKSIYNILKQPVAQYFKKDVIKEGVKTIDILSQKIKGLEVKDKVDTSSNKFEKYEQQVFSYKPSLIQQKMRQVGMNTYSRPYVRQYSI